MNNAGKALLNLSMRLYEMTENVDMHLYGDQLIINWDNGSVEYLMADDGLLVEKVTNIKNEDLINITQKVGNWLEGGADNDD